MSIGESLTQARHQAGLSLAQVSQRTRIRERIIADIENDDYAACGGDFYARGHIRSIARAIGADPEPLIRQYDATQPEAQPVTEAEITEPGIAVRPQPGIAVRPQPGIPVLTEPGTPVSSHPGGPAGATPGRPARAEPDWPARAEPGWPARTGPGRPVRPGPGWPARTKPGRRTGTEPDRPAGREPGQPTRTEPVFPFFTRPAAPAEGRPVPPGGPGRQPPLGGPRQQPPPAAPPATRRRPPLNWAALVALALLAGIGYLAYHIFAGSSGATSSAHTARAHPVTHPPAGHSSPAPTPATSPSPSAKPTPPARPLIPASAQAIGVSGHGDNPANASLAIDRTPGTAWRTDWYTTADFGNLYSGTGLLVDMGLPVKITAARITFGPGHGGRFQLRVGPRPSLPGLRPVAHASAAGVARLRLASPARGRYVLIWLTSLPADRAGTYRASVYDLRLRGR